MQSSISPAILSSVIVNDSVQFDAELIAKYDRNGPRYTSYPTAMEFHAGIGERDYAQVLQASGHTAPLSLYVHVPFCASPCFYCGCNRVITRDPRKGAQYMEYLLKEIAMVGALMPSPRPVTQVHLGGGTPTFLTLSQLDTLLAALQETFHFDVHDPKMECSIEIDPRTLPDHALPELAALGFNRISLGVQDMNPAVQEAVNRLQSAEQTLGAIQRARELGYKSINVDLIYGLPKQTLASFAETLNTMIAAKPDRIAAYGYAHMPHMFKAQRQLNAADLPSPAQRLQLLELTISKLCDAGYQYVGMDHFALPDDELVLAQQRGALHRNFQGYSTQAECDLIGLGPSAIGKVGELYVQNQRALNDYYNALMQQKLPLARGLRMTAEDHLRGAVIQQIMCHGQVTYAEFDQRLGIRFTTMFSNELVELGALESDGLIVMNPQGFHATPAGRLLLRHVAMVFDQYLQASNTQRFSKAI